MKINIKLIQIMKRVKLIIRAKNKKIYDIYIVINKENKKIKSMDNKYIDEDDIENDNLEN